MNNHAKNVLWADDDAGDTLQPIARLLKTRGKLALAIAEDYYQAMTALEHAAKNGPNELYSTLIVDTILPPGIHDAALGNYLGIKLADVAARSHGIEVIIFLSVVPYGEIADHFSNLKNKHPSVSFSYFNKLVLFQGQHFANLLETIR